MAENLKTTRYKLTKNNELVLEGRIRDIADYLGVDKNNIYQYFYKRKEFNGYLITKSNVQYLVEVYVNGKLDFVGTRKEVSKKYYIPRDFLSRAIKHNKLIYQEFTFKEKLYETDRKMEI